MTERLTGRTTLILGAFAAALLLRSVLQYPHVFAGEVHFQGFDPWFHMRTVRNLMQHFPHRSGFDPYSAFPSGQVVPTGPLYDLAIGWIAWILGAGSPSGALVDAVGAWFPAVLGALITFPVCAVTSRLANPVAGVFAAWIAALFPGEFLASSVLGFTDHHVAESLLSILFLLFLVCALQDGRAKYTILAGISLGGFLEVRPAGAFLIAPLLFWAIIQCGFDVQAKRASWTLWKILTASLFIAWLLFLPARGLMWSQYTVAALWGGIAGASAAAVAAQIALTTRRPAWAYIGIVGAAALAIAVVVAAFRPSIATSLLAEILHRTTAGPAQTVREMQPLLWPAGSFSLRPLWAEFALVWLFAIPGAWLLLSRTIRPEESDKQRTLILVLIWCAAMIGASLIEYRMVVYAAVGLAILGGLAAARVWTLPGGRNRLAAIGLVTALLYLPELASAWTVVSRDNSPSSDWLNALLWLRDQTPEPMPGRDFDGFFARLPEGQQFPYPASAYGVMNWWNSGHLISAIGRRIPVSNGMQTGELTAAQFFTSTDPAAAARLLSQSRIRYVFVDSSLPVPQGSQFARGGGQFIAMAVAAGMVVADYCENVRVRLPDGGIKTVTIFRPEYYQTMLARLYLFDGAAVEPHSSTFVAQYEETMQAGRSIKTVTGLRNFATYAEALAFQRANPGNTLLVGLYPSRSCVPLEKSVGFRLAFTSQPNLAARNGAAESQVHATKIFAVQP